MVSSKAKGNRGEREVVKLLKDYWKDDGFMKSPESGGLATMLEGYGNVPQDIVGRLAGDIMVPTDFPFCVEVKTYAEIDLYQLIRNPWNCEIRNWWLQCYDDARKAKKIPLLMMKEDRKKRYCIIEWNDYETLKSKQQGRGMPDNPDFGFVGTRIYSEFGTHELCIMEWETFTELFPKNSIL